MLQSVQGRPQEVYGAFAAFRQRRCMPRQRQGKAVVDDEVAGARAGATQASSTVDSGGAGAQAEAAAPALAGQHAVLPQRLLLAAELLHILRPVAYALALRRQVVRASFFTAVLALLLCCCKACCCLPCKLADCIGIG